MDIEIMLNAFLKEFSTYNTGYILVKNIDLNCAVNALRVEGHAIID